MRLPLIYIAGPFRGPTAWDVEQNVRHAEEFGLEVARLGAMPVIPHANTRFFHGQLDDQFWLDGTLRLLEVSDAMVLIPGWTRSTGARGEKAKFEEWGRSERIFDISHQILDDKAPLAKEYDRLRTWIAEFKAAA
jgi:hypothetical protein